MSAIHKEILCLLVPTNPRGWFSGLSAGSSLSDVFVPWLSDLGQHSRELPMQVLVTATFHSAGQARHVKQAGRRNPMSKIGGPVSLLLQWCRLQHTLLGSLLSVPSKEKGDSGSLGTMRTPRA